jgi:hypothetical protein
LETVLVVLGGEEPVGTLLVVVGVELVVMVVQQTPHTPVVGLVDQPVPQVVEALEEAKLIYFPIHY